jgi:phage terminase large subunit-like protein
MNTIEQLVEALIARLRMMQSALGVDETCGEAAAALERLTAERDSVVWGVDWGKLGDRTSITIVKRRQDGTIEVVATEVEPK